MTMIRKEMMVKSEMKSCESKAYAGDGAAAPDFQRIKFGIAGCDGGGHNWPIVELIRRKLGGAVATQSWRSFTPRSFR